MKGHELPGPNQRKSPAKHYIKPKGKNQANLHNSSLGNAYAHALAHGKSKGEARKTWEEKNKGKKEAETTKDAATTKDAQSVSESPAKGRMWDALKKGEFKKAANVAKREAKAIAAGIAGREGYNLKAENRAGRAAYRREKKRQAEEKAARKAARTKAGKSPAKCPLLALAGPVMDMIGKKKE